MKLLPAHVDETQTRFRLLGPKSNAPATTAEPGPQGEVHGRRDGFQAGAANAADHRVAAWKEPSR
jgi:hypothetical protein